MPTSLTVTASELFARMPQLAVADELDPHDQRPTGHGRPFRLKIALAIKAPTRDREVGFAGSIALRVS